MTTSDLKTEAKLTIEKLDILSIPEQMEILQELFLVYITLNR